MFIHHLLVTAISLSYARKAQHNKLELASLKVQPACLRATSNARVLVQENINSYRSTSRAAFLLYSSEAEPIDYKYAIFSIKRRCDTNRSKAHQQSTMELQLEDELRNVIFHDAKFIDHFLAGDNDKLTKVVKHCRKQDQQLKRKKKWSIPERVSDEKELYAPVLKVLNTIKKAVDDVHGFPEAMVPSLEDVEPEVIIDNHKYPINSDLANTQLIKPDLVLFQDAQRHWENVRLPIEIKRLPGHHKVGMKQLSRYARAVFAHQLHRRHLYGLIVCGREATFVRFDRAGILYSGRIDIVEQSEVFTRAFASLLMLDRVDEGLDPAFKFSRNSKGRLVYYIDLPESEVDKLSGELPPDKELASTSSQRMRRFEVIERLCHRESICGRATIVLRIREVVERQQQTKAKKSGKGKGKGRRRATKKAEPREYALKLMWRDPDRDSEGDVLEKVHGMFGLAQYAGHWDVPGRSLSATAAGDNTNAR
ncbi:hypothetical protein BN14_11425 [Rhizoctonia solani AG-1 IB]|uniref:Fungal-type protein kinase domain-containing protein n=1 Tax=Thanatephorus cucumeris (strain AG1-IB / isolate 7/3/14) TaxID=1108050 RepID=M5CDP7_THACB|nr:hypothetical protein BN14_11425 [Rhizoctonia solani AG-1 IB]